VPVVDPDADRLPAKFSGDHQVQIPIAINVSGSDVQTTSGTRRHFKCGPWLFAEEDFDLVLIDPVY
jgi:hypothetical protein